MASENIKYPGLDEIIAFHGHLCPGLAIGYRAAVAGLKRLGVKRAEDEELIAIVENSSCSVDAVQFLTGATFGKGNLFFRDWGKQVFTFARRGQPGAVRVSLKAGALKPRPEPAESAGQGAAAPGMGIPEKTAGWRQERIDYILNAPLEELFDIREVEIELPPEAQIHQSITCDRCGEPVMETRIVLQNNQKLCTECAGRA